MADFEKAYNKVVIHHEGGYVNDPDDPGGETFGGISRRSHPKWQGWKIIDAMKKHPEFPKCLYRDQQLLQLKRELYLNEYWTNSYDLIADDELSTKLFDLAVHSGRAKSTVLLQRTLNVLNKRETIYKNIRVDGIFGERTVAALGSCQANYEAKLIVNVLNGFQMKFYLELMEGNETLEKYIGWFKRVEINW